jgi:carbonic anhydrase
MRLFDAILEANRRAANGDAMAGIRPADFPDSLPLVAVTCIDPRLNRLMPEVLGIPEDQFIWLRNAGNIIFGTTSSMTRTLALACAVKGGKEIAIIGHTDCKVRQTSVLQLTDRFRDLGINRAQLPENLNEFFGLFASERQNVLRGVEFIRQSPLIGPRIPVHGLLVDIENGKLEWVVNGYEALERATATQPALVPSMPEFKLGEMKFPDVKIGEVQVPQRPVSAPASISAPTPVHVPHPAEPDELPHAPAPEQAGAHRAKPRFSMPKLDPQALFKIVGADKKIYGPVSGQEIAQWMTEGRVQLSTLIQKIGNKKWQQVAELLAKDLPQDIPIPPPLRRPFIHQQDDEPK